MSFVYTKEKRKKGKHPRWNHKNYHLARKRIKRTKKLRNSGWKLNYPDLFELVENIPYIVRKK